MPEELREIRIHSRGGQGGWLSSRILSIAAMYEGFNIKSFPEFGPERTGAPTVNFARYSNKPIRLACEVYEPQCVIVIEPNLFETKTEDILKGLNPGRRLIANCGRKLEFPDIETHSIDITKLARKKYGIGYVNVGILGGYIKVSGDIRLKSLRKAIMDEMTTKDVEGRLMTKAAEVNVALMEDVYHQMK